MKEPMETHISNVLADRIKQIVSGAPTGSPWGRIQTCEQIHPGIWHVTTASHGGLYLSDDRVEQMKLLLGDDYNTFCGEPQWFEEDCDWALVAIAFRNEFDSKRVQGAINLSRSIARGRPDGNHAKVLTSRA